MKNSLFGLGELEDYKKYFLVNELNLDIEKNRGEFEKDLKNRVDNLIFSKGEFKEGNNNGIKSIYLIESHIINEGKDINKDNNYEIEITANKKYYKFISEIKKIRSQEIKEEENQYSINVYRINFDINLIPKKQIIISEDNDKTVELIINLKQNKNEFNSKHIIKIEKNNFLGKINFEVSTSFFIFKNTPPKTIELSDFQVVKLFHESLLNEKKITT